MHYAATRLPSQPECDPSYGLGVSACQSSSFKYNSKLRYQPSVASLNPFPSHPEPQRGKGAKGRTGIAQGNALIFTHIF